MALGRASDRPARKMKMAARAVMCCPRRQENSYALFQALACICSKPILPAR